MVEYIIKRLLLMVVTLFGIIVLTFAITRMAPGDPVSGQAGGEGQVNDAAIMEGIRAQRRIYGLDKPLFLNLHGEERGWFALDALTRATTPKHGKTQEVERKIAARELIEQSTALYPDLIPLLPTLVDADALGKKLAKFQKAADARLKALGAEPDAEEVEAAKADIVAKAKELEVADYALVEIGGDGKLLAEADPAAVQEGEKLKAILDALEAGKRHNLPAGFARKADKEKIAYWTDYWKSFSAGGDWRAKVAETTKKALASPAGELAEESDRLGPLAAADLIEAVRDSASPATKSRALAYLARAARTPGWAPQGRGVAEHMRDHYLPSSTQIRGEMTKQLVSTFEAGQAKAIVGADGGARRGALASVSTFWNLPALMGAYFEADDFAAKEDIWKAMESALSESSRRSVAGQERMRSWPTVERLFEGVVAEKLALIDKWWERGQYRLSDFGFLRQSWNAVANTQFGSWLGNIVRLDFDESYRYKRPVLQLIWERLPVTLALSFLSIFLAYVIAIPLGIKSAVDYHSVSDKVVTLILFVLYSLPSFWVGEMLIIFFCSPDFYEWFPSFGLGTRDLSDGKLAWAWEKVRHLTLPVACLTYSSFASLSRYMRSSMLETIRQDYIRTARAKGLKESMVVYKHALRNSLIPILTLAATMLPALISGSVIIETVFTIDGMGKLAVDAVFNRDYPLINAIAIFTAVLTLLGILLSDLSYALVDPRITYK